MHKKIRTVIFDCDFTMWDGVPIKKVAEELGIPNQRRFAKEFDHMIIQFNKEFATKKVTEMKTHKLIEKSMPILEAHNISVEDFLECWKEGKYRVLKKYILLVLEYLKAQGCSIVVKTDWFAKWQKEQMETFGICQYIDKVYGCDNTYLKCNPRSANGVIDKRKRGSYIMIGDGLETDICFAQHAGIQSIWLNENGKVNTTEYKPTYEIKSLLEIMQIL